MYVYLSIVFLKSEMSQVNSWAGSHSHFENSELSFFSSHFFRFWPFSIMFRLALVLLAAFATYQATAAPCNPCGDAYTMTGSGGSFSDGAGT
jgi:hypothetical protein